MMSINKENISEYLKASGESTAELLGHLRSLLQASAKYHGTFTENSGYRLYVEQARKRGILPDATKEIIQDLASVGPVSKEFLESTFKNKIRQRF